MRKMPLLVTAFAALAQAPVHAQPQPQPQPQPQAQAPAREPHTVRIAHAGPLSGQMAAYGRDIDNGMRLAIDTLNAVHPVVGGRSVRFELVSEDDAADPKQATVVAHKLCDMRVAAVVGHGTSGTAIPAARIYHGCGIPNISPSATNPELTRPRYPTTFRLQASDSVLGARVAAYAAQVLKLRTVAVMDDRSAYGQGVSAVFRETAQGLGITVLPAENVSDRAVDFMPVLTTIKALDPDAIFFGGMDPQAGPMLRQMEQLGMTRQKFLGGDGICTPGLVTNSAGAAPLANVVCAEGGAPMERLAGGVPWRKRYDARFPGAFQAYSPYAYDAVQVLADAMARAGSTDPAVFTPHIARTDLQGVTGRLRFDARGELREPPVTLYSYPSGRKTRLAWSGD